jgi:ribonuclease HII
MQPVQDSRLFQQDAFCQPGNHLRQSGGPWRRCGLDEVGRGALAGPLVAAGVVLPDDMSARLGARARYLRDSKTVPRGRRSEIAGLIRRYAVVVEVVAIPIEMINQHGIGWANREAFCQLIERISADEYIVDGSVRPHAPADRAIRVRCLVKADAQIPEVSAASLVAKVYRDELMAELHKESPIFGWDRNAGYGTASHLAALREYGPTLQHRTLFVRTALAPSLWPSPE